MIIHEKRDIVNNSRLVSHSRHNVRSNFRGPGCFGCRINLWKLLSGLICNLIQFFGNFFAGRIEFRVENLSEILNYLPSMNIMGKD